MFRYKLRTLLIVLAVLTAWGVATYRHYWNPAAPEAAGQYWPGMMLMDRTGNMIHVGSDGTRASGVPALIELLKHESPGIRESAAGWLGSIGSDAKTALPELQTLQSDDPDEGVRRAAADAAKQIGTSSP
jgi:hypothetical protein